MSEKLAEVKINTYYVRIRKSKRGRKKEDDQQTEEFMKFGEIEHKEVNEAGDPTVEFSDFHSLFTDYVQHFNGQFFVNTRSGNALYVPSDNTSFASQERLITGTVRGGNSGTPRSVTAANEAEAEPLFRITRDHVDYREYFYLLWLPEDADVGILIVQGLASFSVATVFRQHLSKFFSEKYSLICSFERFVPPEMVEDIKSGSKVSKIVFRRYKLPADIAQDITGFSFINDEVTIELSIKMKDLLAQKLSDGFYNMNRDSILFTTTPELQNIGMDGDHDVSIEHEKKGKKFTAVSRNQFQFNPYIYVPVDNLDYNEDTGLPSLDSIRNYCLSLFQRLKSDLRI